MKILRQTINDCQWSYCKHKFFKKYASYHDIYWIMISSIQIIQLLTSKYNTEMYSSLPSSQSLTIHGGCIIFHFNLSGTLKHSDEYSFPYEE